MVKKKPRTFNPPVGMKIMTSMCFILVAIAVALHLGLVFDYIQFNPYVLQLTSLGSSAFGFLIGYYTANNKDSR